MDDPLKQRLTRRDVWLRALLMVFFLIAYSIAELVVWVVVLLQFVIVLITGKANENLLLLGNNLSAYVYQVLRFQTFNTETQAFPFTDWPKEPVAVDNVWTRDAGETAEDHPRSDAQRAADHAAEDESQPRP